MRDIYYIENIDISDNSVTLILTMNFYMSAYNDMDEFPVTEIKLINPRINLTIESIKESVDLYNNGFIFDISEDNMILQTIDMGNRKSEILCENISVLTRKYNYNELEVLIKQYKECQETSQLTMNQLNTKIDTLKSLIHREIDSLENKLKTTRLLPFENKKNQWQIELNIYKRMIERIK
jgi:hypothetical protein